MCWLGVGVVVNIELLFIFVMKRHITVWWFAAVVAVAPLWLLTTH